MALVKINESTLAKISIVKIIKVFPALSLQNGMKSFLSVPVFCREFLFAFFSLGKRFLLRNLVD